MINFINISFYPLIQEQIRGMRIKYSCEWCGKSGIGNYSCKCGFNVDEPEFNQLIGATILEMTVIRGPGGEMIQQKLRDTSGNIFYASMPMVGNINNHLGQPQKTGSDITECEIWVSSENGEKVPVKLKGKWLKRSYGQMWLFVLDEFYKLRLGSNLCIDESDIITLENKGWNLLSTQDLGHFGSLEDAQEEELAQDDTIWVLGWAYGEPTAHMPCLDEEDDE